MPTFFATIYDALHSFWESSRTQRVLTFSLIVVFLLSLLGIELNRFHFVPQWISIYIPTNHFASISLVFTLVLLVEVIGLVFTIGYSVSKALCMQLEILALILIRQSFKGISTLEETLLLESEAQFIWNIILPAIAAVCIFICVILYKNLHNTSHHTPSISLHGYIMAKKTISCGVLLGVMSICLYALYKHFILHKPALFFESVYSLLIFSDILLVLVSQYYIPSFLGMFRNSAFVVCTLLIRIALSAKIEGMTLLGIFVGLYALLITWITTRLADRNQIQEEEEEDAQI